MSSLSLLFTQYMANSSKLDSASAFRWLVVVPLLLSLVRSCCTDIDVVPMSGFGNSLLFVGRRFTSITQCNVSPDAG